MSNYYPELSQKILEMSEGDEEFRVELTSAIYVGLIELQVKYAEGRVEKDEVKIQQIRHKVKPTLTMFEFASLAAKIQEGKIVLESFGFGTQFDNHFEGFEQEVELALEEVKALTRS